jgi:hypothetical protein
MSKLAGRYVFHDEIRIPWTGARITPKSMRVCVRCPTILSRHNREKYCSVCSRKTLERPCGRLRRAER